MPYFILFFIISLVSFILLCVLGFTLLLYVPLNRQDPRYHFDVILDSSIPLIPFTVWIYLSYYLLLPLSIIFLWKHPLLNNYLITQTIATLSAATIWKIFPNGVHRPTITEPQKLPEKILKIIYHHDKDTNGLPSGHVLHSFIACYFLSLTFPHLWLLMFLLLMAISISTLTTKQHYYLDIVITLIVTPLFIEVTLGRFSQEFNKFIMYIIRS